MPNLRGTTKGLALDSAKLINIWPKLGLAHTQKLELNL